ncbi:MAG: hypoxanthine phosphoribosyltransferase [Rhodothermales bacterium]|nr:hypoxanthine phosphoribosyltransferase [Rhodothermales bacterium]MBO6780572.1 hypoxanthine phosphoribosyltransferase [Rhodothermales bacterium]
MQSTLKTASDSVVINGDRFRPYLTRDVIADRVRAIAAQIDRDLDGTVPILVGVLNGAFIFLADLMRELSIECEVDFLKLSSYGAAKISSGKVHELKSLDADIEGRHVILVEDIVDTGLSMQFLMDKMQELKPASVRTAVLLHKVDATRIPLSLDYVGFEIDNLFVVGYGLDYAQVGRQLADIYILDDD